MAKKTMPQLDREPLLTLKLSKKRVERLVNLLEIASAEDGNELDAAVAKIIDAQVNIQLGNIVEQVNEVCVDCACKVYIPKELLKGKYTEGSEQFYCPFCGDDKCSAPRCKPCLTTHLKSEVASVS